MHGTIEHTTASKGDQQGSGRSIVVLTITGQTYPASTAMVVTGVLSSSVNGSVTYTIIVACYLSLHMTNSTLFHLHFNTPDVAGAAARLHHAGIPLQRRFGSIRGDGIALDPSDRKPDGFRLKLQVHQYGAVNITLAPGQRPHFDHVGLRVESTKEIRDRAASRDWSVRPNDRRTFVMTPWNFRVEIHSATSDVVAELGSSDEAHFDNVVLRLPEATTAREVLNKVFGHIPELQVVSGKGPWIDSFTIANEQSASTIHVQTLLGNQETSP